MNYSFRQQVITSLEWFRATQSSGNERWILWTPVAFGGGAALYWTAPVEPYLFAGGSIAFPIMVLLIFLYRQPGSHFRICVALFLIAAGFQNAALQTWFSGGPLLEEETGLVTVKGEILRNEAQGRHFRLTIRPVTIDGIAGDEIPSVIRIVVRSGIAGAATEPLYPGDLVAVTGILRPLPRPTHPGGFDFRLWAWFQGIGAGGYATQPVERLAAEELAAATEKSWTAGFYQSLSRIRQGITNRIRAAVPGEPGDVAAALITGDRSGLDRETQDQMRDAGLAHLLAISGLHLGLVATTVFFTVRFLAALIPSIALYYPVKKWAAFLALVCSFLYLMISAAPVPTQRAFLTTGLVLLAVLLNRQALSLRLVAIAAFLIILISPVQVMGASFQLSFAAVLALVATYEGLRHREGGREAGWGTLGSLGRYGLGVAATSLIASLATAPFVLFHFGRLALLGIAANLVAVPLMAFLVMPAGLLALVLMPFGWEALPLSLMAWGISGILAVAEWVSRSSFAHTSLPLLSSQAILTYGIGFLFLCLTAGRMRLLGLAPMMIGLFLIGSPKPPDILVSETGGLIAVRDSKTGEYAFSTQRRERFAAQSWRRAYVGGDDASAWPVSDMRCDGFGCVLRRRGLQIAFPTDSRAVPEDCARSDVIVSPLVIPRGQCSQLTQITFFELRRGGAHSIWLDDASLRIETVSELETRPWHGAGP